MHALVIDDDGFILRCRLIANSWADGLSVASAAPGDRAGENACLDVILPMDDAGVDGVETSAVFPTSATRDIP